MTAIRAFLNHPHPHILPMTKLAKSWANLVSFYFSKRLSLILRRHIQVSYHNLGQAHIEAGQKIIEFESAKRNIKIILALSSEVVPYVTHYFFGGIERNYRKLSNPNSFSESFILENFGKIFLSALNQAFQDVENDLDFYYSYQSDAIFCEEFKKEKLLHLISFSFEDHGELFELTLCIPLNLFDKLKLV